MRITSEQILEIARTGKKSQRCGLLFLLASERHAEELLQGVAVSKELKYIVVQDMFGNLAPVMFPKALVHADVAKFQRGPVYSAGFCERGPRGWQCWGRSESLDVDSHEGDEALFARTLGN